MLGLGLEGWVPTQNYEVVVALCKQMKEVALMEVTLEEEWAEIRMHRPWDNMDKQIYM